MKTKYGTEANANLQLDAHLVVKIRCTINAAT